MRLRYPFLILMLMVLAYSCIAGCMYNGENYGSTQKQATPDITPKLPQPPASPAGIPSVATSIPAVFFISIPDLGTGIK